MADVSLGPVILALGAGGAAAWFFTRKGEVEMGRDTNLTEHQAQPHTAGNDAPPPVDSDKAVADRVVAGTTAAEHHPAAAHPAAEKAVKDAVAKGVLAPEKSKPSLDSGSTEAHTVANKTSAGNTAPHEVITHGASAAREKGKASVAKQTGIHVPLKPPMSSSDFEMVDNPCMRPQIKSISAESIQFHMDIRCLRAFNGKSEPNSRWWWRQKPWHQQGQERVTLMLNVARDEMQFVPPKHSSGKFICTKNAWKYEQDPEYIVNRRIVEDIPEKKNEASKTKGYMDTMWKRRILADAFLYELQQTGGRLIWSPEPTAVSRGETDREPAHEDADRIEAPPNIPPPSIAAAQGSPDVRDDVSPGTQSTVETALTRKMASPPLGSATSRKPERRLPKSTVDTAHKFKPSVVNPEDKVKAAVDTLVKSKPVMTEGRKPESLPQKQNPHAKHPMGMPPPPWAFRRRFGGAFRGL